MQMSSSLTNLLTRCAEKNANLLVSFLLLEGEGEEDGEGFPYMGFIHVGICSPKGYSILAILVIN